MLAIHEDLRRKITAMEKRYDAKFHPLFSTIRQILEMPSITNCTKARMMAMLTWTARSLHRTLESVATPCSVKA